MFQRLDGEGTNHVSVSMSSAVGSNAQLKTKSALLPAAARKNWIFRWIDTAIPLLVSKSRQAHSGRTDRLTETDRQTDRT